MKAVPECMACLFQQALRTARLATDRPELQEAILREVARHVATLSLDDTPAALSQPCYAIVSRLTGVADPYAASRAEGNRAALALLPEVARLVAGASDPLDAALHAAAAGNMIDLGIGHAYDLAGDMRRLLQAPFARCDLADFRRALDRARRVLILGDNAGEIVFDTILVAQLRARGLDVAFAVKSGPIINDALAEDAEDAGMTRLARIVTTGSNDIGVHWGRCSAEFRREVEEADVIVGKGHGNFETCNERLPHAFFLLKAKCPVVAAALGVQFGDIVFAQPGICSGLKSLQVEKSAGRKVKTSGRRGTGEPKR